MLFTAEDLSGIRDGRIDVAFRRWRRPSVKPGTRLRTAAGVVEILAVARIAETDIDDADARRAGAPGRSEILRRLAGVPGDLHRIALRYIGADPRIALRDTVPEEPGAVLHQLDGLDRASRHGPWTRAILALIAANEGVRAAELAARAGRPTLPFKADVRKLKELGLTESLDVGYRLSARGRAVLAAIA